jgi:endoglucanase
MKESGAFVTHIEQPTIPPTRSPRSVLLAGSLGLACAIGLSGCGGGPQQPVERNAPLSADYLIDSDDPYYDRMEELMPQLTAQPAQENLQTLLDAPVAKWVNDLNSETVQMVAEVTDQASAEHTIPTFVIYGMPKIQSEDGNIEASQADMYRSWIGDLSTAIGNRPAVIVLEPDTLAASNDLREDDRSARFDLLRSSLEQFKEQNLQTAVYLDVGHSYWLKADEVVGLMQEIDPDGELIGGISLNVSNQRPEQELRDYVEEIWRLMDKKVYVLLDNAMNGAPNTAELTDYCNPDGERIGRLEDNIFDPTSMVEEMYIKPAGESDNPCGTSSLPAGAYDPNLLSLQVS